MIIAKPTTPLIPQMPYDPSKDPVLEAIRAELVMILTPPLTARGIRDAQALLEHAQGISVLRKGGPVRGRKRYSYNSAYNPAYDDEMGEDDVGTLAGGGVLAPSTMTETMGTHTIREFIGVATMAVEALKPQPLPHAEGHFARAAIESLTRAMSEAQALPEDVRAVVVPQLNAQLGRAIALLGEHLEDPPPEVSGKGTSVLGEAGPTPPAIPSGDAKLVANMAALGDANAIRTAETRPPTVGQLLAYGGPAVSSALLGSLRPAPTVPRWRDRAEADAGAPLGPLGPESSADAPLGSLGPESSADGAPPSSLSPAGAP